MSGIKNIAIYEGVGSDTAKLLIFGLLTSTKMTMNTMPKAKRRNVEHWLITLEIEPNSV